MAQTQFKLKPLEVQTQFAPLCALGYFLTTRNALEPLQQVEIPQKSVKHRPTDKLLDCLIGILTGCSALYQINDTVRPDQTLQKAFGRDDCAEQSVVSETLDACTPQSITQLRQAVEAIDRRFRRVSLAGEQSRPEAITNWQEIWDQFLVVDIDLTGLPASPDAEGSTKGYFPHKRNQTGRQQLRISAPQSGEVLWEKLFAGNTKGFQVLKEALQALERLLCLERKEDRAKILLRLDGGFGTDAAINWVLWRGYQMIAKGYSATRAQKVVATVPPDEWEVGPTLGQELGIPDEPHRYGRKTQSVGRRWQDKQEKEHCDLLITTLMRLSQAGVAKLYDSRSGAESGIKEDKQGLKLEGRRKRDFQGQEALLLLTQLAHNLLVWSRAWFFRGTRIADFGLVRLMEAVLKVPGEVEIRGERIKRIWLKGTHPLAQEVLGGVRQALEGGKGVCSADPPFQALKTVWEGALKWIGQ